MERVVLQQELALLPADEQDKVAAFLTALRMKREGLFAEMQRRLDDHSPESWVPWTRAKAELGLDNAAP